MECKIVVSVFGSDNVGKSEFDIAAGLVLSTVQESGFVVFKDESSIFVFVLGITDDFDIAGVVGVEVAAFVDDCMEVLVAFTLSNVDTVLCFFVVGTPLAVVVVDLIFS